jgi:hypothetical protein
MVPSPRDRAVTAVPAPGRRGLLPAESRGAALAVEPPHVGVASTDNATTPAGPGLFTAKPLPVGEACRPTRPRAERQARRTQRPAPIAPSKRLQRCHPILAYRHDHRSFSDLQGTLA